VITADERHTVWVSDFEAEEEEERFEGVEAPIHKVSHEQVVGVRHVAAHSEEFHKVMELTVYVAAYCYGGVDGDDVALFDQKLPSLVA